MPDQEIQYKKLREERPLGLREDACLVLRAPRYATCRACETACPVQAIKVGEITFELGDACIDCGRCAAACPMGALGLPGFVVPEVKPVQGELSSAKPVPVECWKVPAESSLPDAVRVPCTGGLSTGRLVELAAAAGDRPVQIWDRGWCAACRAGGGPEHPVSGALEAARGLLAGAGVRPEKLPGIAFMPLPAQLMPAEIPSSTSQQTLSRRGFFSAFMRETTAAIDQVRPLAPKSEIRRKRGFERTPMPSRERERLLLGLSILGKSTDKPPPSEAFYRVQISQACRSHNICVGICPTGALDIYEEDAQNGVVFDSYLCIGCGQCVTVCPESAIELSPNGNDLMTIGQLRLTRFGVQDCPVCGQTFTAQGGSDCCPQCAKRRQLASSAFASLFGNNR
ncbi:MAG: hypothetical protein A3F73_03010 [Gallionellales bacterium RIFCSPLOWO2_12_FULL_59_22]|nr:MAG: hypothetical protein A3H99_06665 [Gallionellales bacterium RIFCSPLOWO2_02_FULL_59_110]OGT02898.1 MAG: hypothetical protein A2Z65_03180 [Gallionellales bacterium RIFCSPLOWO2_02_58_13]OGT13101.1 MAG: hypothetical protein A3F73_03010 [Gallionellales bacterium RIFCSPLOWO2_12_FULL_59_22]